MLVIAYPSKKATRNDDIGWIVDRIIKNISNNIQTCIVSAYHTMTIEDFPDLSTNQLVLYADIIHDANTRITGERIFILNDNLLDIGVFFSRIIENAKNVWMPVDIIIHNFSSLIHNLGYKEVYRLLTYKNPELDQKINLILFINPKSHNEQVWQQFRSLARDLIEIKGVKN